jgi:hypothetical protein
MVEFNQRAAVCESCQAEFGVRATTAVTASSSLGQPAAGTKYCGLFLNKLPFGCSLACPPGQRAGSVAAPPSCWLQPQQPPVDDVGEGSSGGLCEPPSAAHAPTPSCHPSRPLQAALMVRRTSTDGQAGVRVGIVATEAPRPCSAAKLPVRPATREPHLVTSSAFWLRARRSGNDAARMAVLA